MIKKLKIFLSVLYGLIALISRRTNYYLNGNLFSNEKCKKGIVQITNDDVRMT